MEMGAACEVDMNRHDSPGLLHAIHRAQHLAEQRAKSILNVFPAVNDGDFLGGGHLGSQLVANPKSRATRFH